MNYIQLIKKKKKEAVKKVIAAMTVGKDVSSLFPDVVNCMQTTNVELKKLVYLYVINYAKAQPELAILAVNTFRKDSLDPNPLIRALAVRTMGCIRLEQITEYLVEPLRRCCRDSDPYVRKTAGICVAKLYDIIPDLVEDQGFVDILEDMLSDSNPMVVANSVAALAEISETASKPILKNIINSSESNVNKLLAAINECTEWGQVFILDALAMYEPQTSNDAEYVMERITARLSHANSAVVLSAIKVVMKLLDKINNSDLVKNIQRKLCPPLVTLLSAEPEIQYVALRNMNLIIQKRPTILANEVKMFYCKYNDPVYVKMEKLDILVRLASDRNIEQVLMELKEYATEVDVDFVRKAVRSIGRCAIKLESAAERCISVLLDLTETRVNYVVQEAVVIIKDIFRKYPNRYESIISTLCNNLDTLDEPEAKASMIWIIGEYAERIDNAEELISSFVNVFHDESVAVQLQILTATVKLFFKQSSGSHELISKVLKMSTEESDNPDLRDRAYVYWRLVSRDPEAARSVVLAEKPIITDEADAIDSNVLDKLMENISMLSSVFHKLPESFVTFVRTPATKEDSDVTESGDECTNTKVERIQVELEKQKYKSSGSENAGDTSSESDSKEYRQVDLIGLEDDNNNFESKTLMEPTGLNSVAKIEVTLLHKDGIPSSHGLKVFVAVSRFNGNIKMFLTLQNFSKLPMSSWIIKFKKNYFGLFPSSELDVDSLLPGETKNITVDVTLNRNNIDIPPTYPLRIEVAMKNNIDIFYFSVPYDINVVLIEDIKLDKETFNKSWTQLGETNQVISIGSFVQQLTIEAICNILESLNSHLILKQSLETCVITYWAAITSNGLKILSEFYFQDGNCTKLITRTKISSLAISYQCLITKVLGIKQSQYRC